MSFLPSLWAGPLAYDVDANGNFLIGLGGTGAYPSILKLNLLRVTGGMPQYDISSSTNYEVVYTPAAGPFQKYTWMGCGLRYNAATDTMYLFGYSNYPQTALTYGGTVACYKNWSTTDWTNTANKAAWITVLPTPNPTFTSSPVDLDFQYYYTGYPSEDGFLYRAFDLANDKIFVSELWGPIHVLDATTGSQIMVMNSGPEVSGQTAWEDEAMGLRAHYNPVTNEYDVLDENSGYRARQNLFRWSPFGGTPAPYPNPGVPGDYDISSPAMAGSASQNGGVFTVNGGGAGFCNGGGTSDQFNICSAQVDGNFSIVGRLTSMSTTYWAPPICGLILRNDVSSGAPEEIAAYFYNAGELMGYRSVANGAWSAAYGPTPQIPVTSKPWFKIVRVGNTFTSYEHADGSSTWILVRSVTMAMNPTLYVGMLVTAGSNTALGTATFDNILITPDGV